jgi:hypothetical protein
MKTNGLGDWIGDRNFPVARGSPIQVRLVVLPESLLGNRWNHEERWRPKIVY